MEVNPYEVAPRQVAILNATNNGLFIEARVCFFLFFGGDMHVQLEYPSAFRWGSMSYCSCQVMFLKARRSAQAETDGEGDKRAKYHQEIELCCPCGKQELRKCALKNVQIAAMQIL
jgi:hypothetical protein